MHPLQSCARAMMSPNISGDMGEVGIGDLFSGRAEAINDLAHLGSVPDQHRIRQQAQTAQESGEPGMVPRRVGGWLYCTQGHPPRYDPALLRTIRSCTGQHSMQFTLYAGLVRKRSRNSRCKRSFDAISYSKETSERSLE